MSSQSYDPPRPLPTHPNLRHLKDQAKDLLDSGQADSLTDAQFRIARLYGFSSWPKLKSHVESLGMVGDLRVAIERENRDEVTRIMSAYPELHRAPLGYSNDGPLTQVAECRGTPSRERLAIAAWMLDHGSDVHQGGDAPLMRAALFGTRIPMMELLVSRGADVNGVWHGEFPVLFAACETLDESALKWLLDHGADANCTAANRVRAVGTALDNVIATYGRESRRLRNCIELLLAVGGNTRYDVPAAIDILRSRLDVLAERIAADPSLLHRQFAELEFGASGERSLTLKGATLLHVAAEYQSREATAFLLEQGADVNARAAVDDAGTGGQTPLFHAVTQFNDGGLSVAELLMQRGADLSIRVKLPGHYERPGEIVECTPLGYALRFGGRSERMTVRLLRQRGAPE